MYINLNILSSRNISLEESNIIQLAKQAKLEDVSAVLSQYSSVVDVLLEKGFIETIKGKKQDTYFQKIRASKKGNELLEAVSIPDVTEEQIRMRDYLTEMYLNHEDEERTIGNKKSIAMYISILQHHLGIDIYRFYFLCEYFLAEYPFTKKLENIFWDKNKNRYKEFKNNVEEATIFQFYEQNKANIENYWAQKIKTNE